MFCPTMVRPPLRGAPVPLAFTVKFSVPLPVPLVLEGTSQAAFELAVHAHPALAVRSTLPLPPAADCTGLFALRLKLQGTPACCTEKLCPATRTAACRALTVEFDAMERLTVPLPLPLVAETGEIQLGPVSALQLQPAGVMTPKEAVPPEEAMDVPGLERLNVQPRPASLTVSVWPAMVMMPVRLVPFGLAAKFRLTVPEPLPAPLPLIQVSTWVVLHAQPVADEFTVMGPLPPLEGRLTVFGCSVKEQAAPNCVMVKARPLTVMAPMRWMPAVFEATV